MGADWGGRIVSFALEVQVRAADARDRTQPGISASFLPGVKREVVSAIRKLSIHLASLANLHNDNDQHGILNLVQDANWSTRPSSLGETFDFSISEALSDSVQLMRAELLAPDRAGIV